MQNPDIIEQYSELMKSPLNDLFDRAYAISQTAHGMLHDQLNANDNEANPDASEAIRNIVGAFKECRSVLMEARTESKRFSKMLGEYLDATLFNLSKLAAETGITSDSVTKYSSSNTVLNEHPTALDVFEVVKIFTNEDIDTIIQKDADDFDVTDDSIYTMRQIMLRYVLPFAEMAKAPANYVKDGFTLTSKFPEAIDTVISKCLDPLDDLLSDEDLIGSMAYETNENIGKIYTQATDLILPVKNISTNFERATKLLKKLLPKLADTHTVMAMAIKLYKDASAITF